MTFAHHNQKAMKSFLRSLAALSLTFALLAARPALALDTGDIVVASIKGEVHIAIRGTDTRLRAGAVLELPATVRTGRDGAIELRQGATSISVGPETLLEFPALATPGGSIDRIVQPRGTAFYNVGKRSGRKLRIETPFLVGVVKGTQFSVVAQDHATNISLFEGLLEIRSADDSDVIDLHAGEIATRDRAATDISVMKMEAGATPPVQKAPATKPVAPNSPAGAGGNPGAPSSKPLPPSGNVVGGPVLADAQRPRHRSRARHRLSPPVVIEGVNVDLGGAAVVDTPDRGVAVDTGTSASEGAAAVVDVSAGNGAATVDLGVNTGATGGSVDVGVGPGQVAVDVDLGLDDDGKDNSGPGNNSGNGNRGPGNGGSGRDNSGPGNAADNLSPIVDTTDLAVGVDTDLGQGAGAATTVDVGSGPCVGRPGRQRERRPWSQRRCGRRTRQHPGRSGCGSRRGDRYRSGSRRRRDRQFGPGQRQRQRQRQQRQREQRQRQRQQWQWQRQQRAGQRCR